MASKFLDHKKIERNVTVLGVLAFLAVIIGGIVEIAPLFWIDSTVEKVEGVRPYTPLELAGLTFGVTHAPGHTEGSVMFTIDDVPQGLDDATAASVTSTVVTGDVLFAGSIGRTDLEGGSDAAMQQSLRTKVLPLPDSSLILPGHGPASTMARERVSNPYLQALQGSGA